MSEPIPSEYGCWWRITDTSQWVNDHLDDLGPAVISLTGYADRLRMHCLLAYVNCRPTKTGVSFTWGAWEYDQMSGAGRVTLGRDGRLKGVIRIKDGVEHVHCRAVGRAGGAGPAASELPGQVAKALVRKP
ncbi:MAG TPA: hypothetical protein VMK12_17200 [Anaeromyxobacteraceae bacterium]|nr:hypothetical protein [Anaeromyxobacteraceae bacterium]